MQSRLNSSRQDFELSSSNPGSGNNTDRDHDNVQGSADALVFHTSTTRTEKASIKKIKMHVSVETVGVLFF